MKKIIVKLLPGNRVECFPPKGVEVEVRDYGFIVMSAFGITEHQLGKPMKYSGPNYKKRVFPHIPRDFG